MKPFSKTGAFIFGLISLLHIIRLVKGSVISVDGFEIPLTASIMGFIVSTVMSWGLWRESKS